MCPGLGYLITIVSKYASTRLTSSCAQKKQPVTAVEEARRFMIDCLKAVGVPDKNSKIVAENLVGADYRGYYSHGMNRLEMYIADVENCRCDGGAECCVIKENIATALINGNNGLGAVVGKFCMDLAIKKAKECGVGMVAARGSNHFGFGGMYGSQAVDQNCIGLTLTNTSPVAVPTRAKQAALGTNPLALGAPGLDGDSFILDMATTAVALGRIELSRKKKESIPEGWALNEEGQNETNPEVAVKAKKLMPLGGTEKNSGYKGYGLGILVEVLSGLLSGSAYGPKIRKWGSNSKDPANLGQGFLAVDPCFFEHGFQNRLSDLMCHLRNLEPVDPKRPVVVHGDVERIHMKKVQTDGGLLYVKAQIEISAKLAERLKVKPLVTK